MKNVLGIISKQYLVVITATLLGFSVSCTREPQEIPEAPQRAGGGSAGSFSQSERENEQMDLPQQLPEGMEATMMMPISEQALRSSIPLQMDKLSYRFSYLNIRREEKITFNAEGKTNISISGLPTGQTGDIVFEILEDNVVKMRGVDRARALTPGRNTSQIKMELVGTGNLEVELIISDQQQQGGGSTPPQGQQQGDTPPQGQQQDNGGSTPPQNQQQGDTTPQNQQQNNGLPPEIAQWDGLQDRPSSRWRIENLPIQ